MKTLAAALLALVLLAGPEVARVAYEQSMRLRGAVPLQAQSGAPGDATYIVQTATAELSNSQALSGLTDGLMRHVEGIVFAYLGGSCPADQAVVSVSAAGALTCAAVPGPQGIQGIQGETGLPGAQGIQGLTGAAGAQRTQGIQGLTGDTGPAGNAGAQGPAGADGAAGNGAPTYAVLSGDVTNATTSYANLTGMTLAVSANTRYSVECVIRYDANATTTGIGIGWTGPASPTLTSGQMIAGLTSATLGGTTSAGNDTGGVTTASVATTANVATFSGLWSNGANAGTIQIRFKSEVAVANAIIAKAGSWCRSSVY